MIHKLASFTVTPDQLDAAHRAIVAFVDTIRRDEPGVTTYESFQVADTAAFRHIMTFTDATAEECHRGAAHTATFVETLYPLCEEPPAFVDLTLVSSNRR